MVGAANVSFAGALGMRKMSQPGVAPGHGSQTSLGAARIGSLAIRKLHSDGAQRAGIHCEDSSLHHSASGVVWPVAFGGGEHGAEASITDASPFRWRDPPNPPPASSRLTL